MTDYFYVEKGYKGGTHSLSVPGDKSLSHRMAIFASLAQGRSRIRGYLKGEDCLNTLKCLGALGISYTFENEEKDVIVEGQGLEKFQESPTALYVGNSGTTLRLLSGLVSGLPFSVCLTGDGSILRRPMERVTKPLEKMGAKVYSFQKKKAPLIFEGGTLSGGEYHTEVASAQVKSAILLAGLHIKDEDTIVYEPAQSRDHTERMLKALGWDIDIKPEENKVHMKPGGIIQSFDMKVPSDPSSAAFFIVSALLLQKECVIKNVGLNPTRIGYIDILTQMGAHIDIQNEKSDMGECVGDVCVHPSELNFCSIKGEIIPNIIDEIPILAIAGACSEEGFEIRDAKELRYKESDRISKMVKGFRALAFDVEEYEDGFFVKKTKSSLEKEVVIETGGDHRIAMAFSVLALISQKGFYIDDKECVDVSFPGFFKCRDMFIKRG